MTPISHHLHGQAVHIASWGQAGQPVALLLHGFCEHSGMFAALGPQLAALGWQVLAPDLPGFGASGYHAPAWASLDDLAHWLDQLLALLGVQQAAVAGHSLGGYLALAYTRLYPHRVRSLALVHSTAAPDTPDQADYRQKSVAFIDEHGLDAYLQAFSARVVAADYRPVHGPIVLDLARASSKAGVQAALLAMATRPDGRPVLAGCTVPVFFLVGQQDPLFQLTDLYGQWVLPALSQVTVLRHCGHMGWTEAPEASAAALCGWLLGLPEWEW